MAASKRSSFSGTLDFTNILYDFLSVEPKSAPPDYYNFAIGDLKKIKSLEPIFQKAFNEGKSKINHLLTNLPGNRGLEELLEILIYDIQRETNYKINRNNIVLDNGGCDGLYNLILATCDIGDKVLYPVPSFPYWSIFNSTGVVQVPLYCYPPEIYVNKIGDILQQKISNGIIPKVLLLNDPSNPIGFRIADAELEKISQLAEKHGFYIIIDNIGHSFLPESYWIGDFFDKDRVLVVDSFTKKYASTGLRLGYVFGNEEIINRVKKLIVNTRGGISNLQALLGYTLINELKKVNEQLINEEAIKRINIKHDAIMIMKDQFDIINFHSTNRSIFSLFEITDKTIRKKYAPIDILKIAENHKIKILGSNFFLPDVKNTNSWIFRISVGGEDRIKEGLNQLGLILKSLIET